MRRIAVTAAIGAFALPGIAMAADQGVVWHPTAGCTSKGPMVRAHDLREQGDPRAAQLLIDRGLAAGSCRAFAAGEPVVIEDGDILAGLSKVHTLGDPDAVWVPERAIRTE